MERLVNWFEQSIAPAASVIIDTQSPEVIHRIFDGGRKRRGPRYNILLGDLTND